jgi:hypothetical protein
VTGPGASGSGTSSPSAAPPGGSPQLQDALKRPDSDVITGPGGKQATVGQIRQELARRARLEADLKSGRAPGIPASGQKQFSLSPNRVALLSAQARARDDENRFADQARGTSAAAAAQAMPPAGAASAPGVRISASQAASQSKVAVALQDGIGAVNGKRQGFVVTPGGKVVVGGHGFGTAAGRVLLRHGAFPGGAIALQVAGWSEHEIDALVPAGVSGLPDLDGVGLEVVVVPLQSVNVTQGRSAPTRSYTIGPGKFVAARVETTFADNLGRLVMFQGSQNWPVAMTPTGAVFRFDQGTSVNCRPPGTDQLVFTVPPGFTVSAVAMSVHSPTDNGTFGGGGLMVSDEQHSFIGAYGYGAWGRTQVGNQMFDSLTINWGVWKDHQDGYIFIPSNDMCMSGYAVSVSVVGPAGLSPF